MKISELGEIQENQEGLELALIMSLHMLLLLLLFIC
jgi:hypothetical protein